MPFRIRLPNFAVSNTKTDGKMKKWILGLFLFATAGAQAQRMTAEEQEAAIRQLTEEVQSLKKERSARAKIKAALPVFSGYMQVRYTYGTDVSEFKMRRVRLSLAGSITPKIDYKLQAEFSGFKLLDAYVDYKPFDELKIKAGQFKVPFSIENTDYSPTRMELLDYPLALQKLMGYSETVGKELLSATGRDTGLSLRGSFFDGGLSYDLGIFNGTGVSASENNKSKDVAARLMLRPAAGLTIAGSCFWGEYGAAHYKRQRSSFGACYDRGPAVLRAECFFGTTGIEGRGDVKSDGFYALAGWRFSPKWLAALRCDTFTADTDARSGTRQTNYTAGISWVPVKHLRLQAEYAHEDLSVRHANGVRMQLTASF